MKKNLSGSRVSAWLIEHQIAELQLTTLLQKELQSFITGLDISSRAAPSAGTLSLCCSGEAPVSIQ